MKQQQQQQTQNICTVSTRYFVHMMGYQINSKEKRNIHSQTKILKFIVRNERTDIHKSEKLKLNDAHDTAYFNKRMKEEEKEEKSHNKSLKWFLSIVSDAISVHVQNKRSRKNREKKIRDARVQFFVYLF